MLGLQSTSDDGELMADDFASHYPILAALVAKQCGNVLELGCGEGSTPMLHYMCKAMKCHLLTMDSSFEWIEKYKTYRTPGHDLVNLPSGMPWLGFMRTYDHMPIRWGVAFVDCAPGGDRTPLIEWLRTRATFVVAHDSERDWGTGANYEYEKVKPLFKYVSEFQRWRPYTLVLSDHEPFEMEECDRTWTPLPHQLAEMHAKGIFK